MLFWRHPWKCFTFVERVLLIQVQYLFDRLHLFVAYWRDGRLVGWLVDCRDEIRCRLDFNFVGGHGRYLGMLWKKIDCVGDVFRFGLVREDRMASVMFQCWAEIPSAGSMWIPGFALLQFLLNDDLHAWWCQRCFTLIEGSFQHVVGGDFGIASGRA
jgi:hypothetical protein